jgi:hypothetical protein
MVNVKKCLLIWKANGSPTLDFEDYSDEPKNKEPYPWASMLSDQEGEVCSSRAAYDIVASYNPEIIPDNVSLVPSPSLQRLFDEAINKELQIATAIKFSHPDTIYNKPILHIGKPDIIVNDEVIEIKYSRKPLQRKWVFQIASYMEYLDIKIGQIVIWSRIDDEIYCHNVIKTTKGYSCKDIEISNQDITATKDNISQKIVMIRSGTKPNPPFLSPIHEDLSTSQCTYIRDPLPRMYVQCHGKTLQNERCKVTVTDEFLCKHHKDQEIEIELEFSDPIIKIKKNCPWYSYCWEQLELHLVQK